MEARYLPTTDMHAAPGRRYNSSQGITAFRSEITVQFTLFKSILAHRRVFQDFRHTSSKIKTYLGET